MTSDRTQLIENSWPDGTESDENGFFWRRIFNPGESLERDSMTRFPRRNLVVYTRSTRRMHLRKQIIGAWRANRQVNLGAFIAVEPHTSFVDGLDTYIDWTTVIVETAAARSYCHAGTPYQCAISAWGVYFGHNHQQNCSHLLPHSYWNVRGQRHNKSCYQGRAQTQQRAESWAVLQALVLTAKQCRRMYGRATLFPYRQIIVSTNSELIMDILGYRISEWSKAEWRDQHWPDRGPPSNHRSFGYMNHVVTIMERMGIFVQFWLTCEEDAQVTGKAKEMAEKRVNEQGKYVRKLYNLLRCFCEHAAKELGYINIPRTTRKRQSAVLEED